MFWWFLTCFQQFFSNITAFTLATLSFIYSTLRPPAYIHITYEIISYKQNTINTSDVLLEQLQFRAYTNITYSDNTIVLHQLLRTNIYIFILSTCERNTCLSVNAWNIYMAKCRSSRASSVNRQFRKAGFKYFCGIHDFLNSLNSGQTKTKCFSSSVSV